MTSLSEDGYIPIANVGDIPAGEGRAFPIQGRVIGLFYVDGLYFALDDFCPHQGASLSAGHVEDGCVRCPWHAWDFHLKDGTWVENPNARFRCETFPVRVDGEDIYIKLT